MTIVTVLVVGLRLNKLYASIKRFDALVLSLLWCLGIMLIRITYFSIVDAAAWQTDIRYVVCLYPLLLIVFAEIITHIPRKNIEIMH